MVAERCRRVIRISDGLIVSDEMTFHATRPERTLAGERAIQESAQ